MQEKPPGEALIEMESLEPGVEPRRPNAAAIGAIAGGIVAAVLALLLIASKKIDPLPPTWWYALVVLSMMTMLLALIGWAKSKSPRTAGRKRSITALVLGIMGVVLSFTVGAGAFSPKPQKVAGGRGNRAAQ